MVRAGPALALKRILSIGWVAGAMFNDLEAEEIVNCIQSNAVIRFDSDLRAERRIFSRIGDLAL